MCVCLFVGVRKEQGTHLKPCVLRTFLRLDTGILEFHERRRPEHRRSDHKFRFPSRRETIRFHLAIYIRATVTYVRQIEPENRAHVSWRSREAPAASRGCLGHLSSPLTTSPCLYRALNLLIPDLYLFRGTLEFFSQVDPTQGSCKKTFVSECRRNGSLGGMNWEAVSCVLLLPEDSYNLKAGPMSREMLR